MKKHTYSSPAICTTDTEVDLFISTTVFESAWISKDGVSCKARPSNGTNRNS